MTDERIERVARAICRGELMNEDDRAGGWHHWGQAAQEVLIELGPDLAPHQKILSELKRLHEICGQQSTADLIAEIEASGSPAVSVND